MYNLRNRGNGQVEIYCEKPNCGINSTDVSNPIITKYEYCNRIKKEFEKCGLVCSDMKRQNFRDEFTVWF